LLDLQEPTAANESFVWAAYERGDSFATEQSVRKNVSWQSAQRANVFLFAFTQRTAA